MTGREFLEKMLEPIKDRLGSGRYKASEGCIRDSMEDPDENSYDPYEEEDVLVELSRKAAAGRVLLLLDGKFINFVSLLSLLSLVSLFSLSVLFA